MTPVPRVCSYCLASCSSSSDSPGPDNYHDSKILKAVIEDSALLRVERLPEFVYTVATDYSDREEFEARDCVESSKDGQLYPFMIQGGELICFQDLRNQTGPFRRLAVGRRVRRFRPREWWQAQDRLAWYVTLLNRTLNKISGHKGLNFDRAHRRYYFMPREKGKPFDIRPAVEQIER